MHSEEWLAGFEAAKKRAADLMEMVAAVSLDESRRETRLRAAKAIRGIEPKAED